MNSSDLQNAEFASTRWSCVVQAGTPESDRAETALSELCAQYWYPLYAYLRRKGNAQHTAEDTIQSFFAWLIEKGVLDRADKDRGKFRSFLIAALNQFVLRQQRFDGAAKRNPPTPLQSISFIQGEERYQNEPGHNLTPEVLYEHAWAVSLLDTTMRRLKEEYERKGKSEQFSVLFGFLSGNSDIKTADAAKQLQKSEASVRDITRRMKRRYAKLLSMEVAGTLCEGESIDSELKQLMTSLRR